MFIDSAFYDDPEHKYPTVEEQIALARRVAQSVLAPANVNSRGHKMFVKRRERSVRWEAGYKPPSETAADDVARLEPAHAHTDKATPTSGDVTSPPPPQSAPVPLTSFVFAPKLPDPEKLNTEKLDALSSEELERVLLMEKKTTHTNIAPQVRHRHLLSSTVVKGKLRNVVLPLPVYGSSSISKTATKRYAISIYMSVGTYAGRRGWCCCSKFRYFF